MIRSKLKKGQQGKEKRETEPKLITKAEVREEDSDSLSSDQELNLMGLEEKPQFGIQEEDIDQDLENGEQFQQDGKQELAQEANPEILSNRIKEILSTLKDFSSLRNPEMSRMSYISQLKADLSSLYSYNIGLLHVLFDLFSPQEAYQFIEASQAPHPLTIRVNTLKTRRKELAKSLVQRGVNLEALADWTKVCLKIIDSKVPIGATPEYLAGHYMLQSASSLLPVMALNPQPQDKVLDLCASPGGKTTYIAQIMKNQGVLFANDINPKRMFSLTGNIMRLGVDNVIVTNMDGRKYPSMATGFNRVLLDAPCSGMGVISRDPTIKGQRTYQEILKSSHLQKQLILAAIDCLETSGGKKKKKKEETSEQETGILVYSTCSITVEENEAVIDYALRKRYVKVIDSSLPIGAPGISRHKKARLHQSVQKCRRVYPHTHNMDGFFIAKLMKYGNGERKRVKEEEKENGQKQKEEKQEKKLKREEKLERKELKKKAKKKKQEKNNQNDQ